MELINNCYLSEEITLRIPNSKAIIENGILFVKISDRNTLDLLIEIKMRLVKLVRSNSKKIYGVQKTLCCIEEFYCNPIKFKPIKNNYEDVIKINNINPEILNNGIIIIRINKLWFDEKSWGPCITAESGECSTNEEVLFLSDSSDSEIEF